MHPRPWILPSFTTKKAAILDSLSVPKDAYTDLSPKGTVDEAIKDLIDRVNALEGIVTTSSCAGRASVFLEGRKQIKERDIKDVREDKKLVQEAQTAVPGGKGMGGRWLFVSHEPLEIPNDISMSASLGMKSMQATQSPITLQTPSKIRLARFQFEPMILHIMAASLQHAQSILAAAIDAGFRESGVQSLRNLSDANSFPMIAIRSSGLALESIVGAAVNNWEEEGSADEEVGSIVDENYLELLVKLANARFETNSERMRRFEDNLFGSKKGLGTELEDGNARRERKKAEGLSKQKSLRKEAEGRMIKTTVHLDGDYDKDLQNATIFKYLSLS